MTWCQERLQVETTYLVSVGLRSPTGMSFLSSPSPQSPHLRGGGDPFTWTQTRCMPTTHGVWTLLVLIQAPIRKTHAVLRADTWWEH